MALRKIKTSCKVFLTYMYHCESFFSYDVSFFSDSIPQFSLTPIYIVMSDFYPCTDSATAHNTRERVLQDVKIDR